MIGTGICSGREDFREPVAQCAGLVRIHPVAADEENLSLRAALKALECRRLLNALIVEGQRERLIGFELLVFHILSRMISPLPVVPHRRQPAAMKQNPGFVDRTSRALT